MRRSQSSDRRGSARARRLLLRSRIASSTTAWFRWNASAATVSSAVLVMNAWCRQSGNNWAWRPVRRVRRTTRRTVLWFLAVPVV